MNSIISFDVSSVSTGWAFLDSGKVKDIGLIKIPSTYTLQQKLYWFEKNIEALFKVLRPDFVLIEETYLKNVKTLKTLMQFIAIVNIKAYEFLYVESIFISPNTVRSHFKLKNKEEVFEYLKNKYKVKFKNLKFEDGNDMSDALLQALYWYDVLNEKEKKDE